MIEYQSVLGMEVSLTNIYYWHEKWKQIHNRLEKIIKIILSGLANLSPIHSKNFISLRENTLFWILNKGDLWSFRVTACVYYDFNDIIITRIIKNSQIGVH